MAIGRILCTTICIISTYGTGVAQAQDDAQRVSVADRDRGPYEQAGIRLGSFIFLPSAELTTTYNDNIFADDTGARDDVIFTIRPEARIRSDTPVHSLDLTASYQRDFYARFGSEDTTEFGLESQGRVDIARGSRLYTNFTINRLAEQRGSLASFDASASPVRYDNAIGELAIEQDLGSLRLRGSGRMRRISYKDTTTLAGQPIDQAFRDLTVYTGTVQAGYNAGGPTTVFVRGTYDRRIYDLRPGDPGFDPLTQTDRSARGGRVEIGASRQISALFYATLRVGYLKQNYSDVRLRDVDGLSYAADLLWNANALTSVRASIERRIDETTSPTTAGNLRNEGDFRVDHELLRNLILSVDGRYARISPAGLGTKSEEYEAGLGARYLINRRFQLEGGARFQSRSSNNRAIAYSANTVFVGLRFAI